MSPIKGISEQVEGAGQEGLPHAGTEGGVVWATIQVTVLLISHAKQPCSQPSAGDRKLIFIRFIPDTWEP